MCARESLQTQQRYHNVFQGPEQGGGNLTLTPRPTPIPAIERIS